MSRRAAHLVSGLRPGLTVCRRQFGKQKGKTFIFLLAVTDSIEYADCKSCLRRVGNKRYGTNAMFPPFLNLEPLD